jgi:hypothetical protein
MAPCDAHYAVLRVRRGMRHFLADCLFENHWGQT